MIYIDACILNYKYIYLDILNEYAYTNNTYIYIVCMYVCTHTHT